MPKLFNIQPRWRNLLLVRALLFAISIVLSSSGADVEPFDTTDANLAAPRRLLGEVPVTDPLVRELQHSKSAKSKSAKSKSSKTSSGKSSKTVGSKSGSKGSKSKSAKSNTKSGKSKAAKAWSKSTGSKGGKSKKSSSKGVKSAKSSEEGKSAKSTYSDASSVDEPFGTKSLNDIEPMLIDEVETERMPIPLVEEEQTYVDTSVEAASSAEMEETIYNDSVENQEVSNNTISEEEVESMEEFFRSEEMDLQDGASGENIDEEGLLNNDLEEEKVIEDKFDIDVGVEEQSVESNSNSQDEDVDQQTVIDNTAHNRAEDIESATPSDEKHVDAENAPDKLEAEFMEERIEESEMVDKAAVE